MSICMRRVLSLSKKCSISNKSYSLQYFSAISSMRDRTGLSKDLKIYTCIKINKLNAVQNRNFSQSYLQHVQGLYDSIGSSTACKLVKEILVETHNFTGFSWTVIIIAASAVLRLFVALPCGIYQRFLAAKIELTNMELAGMKKTLGEKFMAKAIKELWTKKKVESEFKSEFKKQRKILFVKNNCHPFKAAILLFMQLPFWLLMSVALRQFAVDVCKGQSDYPKAALQFQVSGPFWCPNLSLPDPKLVLPAINFLALLTYTELSYLFESPEKNTLNKAKFLINKVLPNISRLLAVVFFFISAALPSGLSLFWASCSLIAVGQNLLLVSPKMRRFFKIPITPSELNKPYSLIWNRFVEKLRMIFPGKNE